MPLVAKKNPVALMLEDMAEWILKNAEPQTSIEGGVKDMLVMEAVYKSLREQKVVYLNNIDFKENVWRKVVSE